MDAEAIAAGTIVMPKLGLTMEEGHLSEWRVRPGDRVAPGDVLFVVETDKIANEIEAQAAAEIGEILVDAGETVPVGTPLARLAGSAPAPARAGPPGEAPAPAAGTMAGGSRAAPRTDAGERIRATPLARRIARDKGLDLAALLGRGSGAGGRIKAADVAALEATEKAARRPDAEAPAPAPTPAIAPAAAERIEMSPKHRAMADRVVRAKREIPHFYLTREVEMSAAMALRAALLAAGGPKVTVTHLVLKAVGRALAARPDMNRIFEGEALWQLGPADVGMVVDTGDALFIPVLRDVAAAPLDRLAADAARLAEAARTGALARSDLEGGAISVSSLGMTGALTVAPIVSPPQSAILGVGRAQATFRPGPDGAPVAATVATLTLAADHRVHTGLSAARFLDEVARVLETPHALVHTLPPDGRS